MRRVVTSARFEKRLVTFIKRHPELRVELEKLIYLLASEDRLPVSLRAHKLTGTLAGCTSVRISYSYRLIFFRTDEKLSLVDVGNHEDVYR